MKKVPSYPKITAKTNITVMQTQNININSPKATALKKGFKNDIKKPLSPNIIKRNQSQLTLVKNQQKKSVQPFRKDSKKIMKQPMSTINQKSIKNSKSQRQLTILSQKLKKLQEKIKKMKEKQKTQKNSASSHRSFSKKNSSSSFAKRQATSSRKQLNLAKKYTLLPRTESQKGLKKSHSDKIQFEVLDYSKNKKKDELLKKSKINNQQKLIIGKLSKQKHDQQVLHKFVTQVPNTHSNNLKQSVQKSLSNNNNLYAVTPSIESEEQQEQFQQYYIGKAIKSLIRPALFSIRQHLIQSLQTLQFLQNIKKPSQKQIEKKQVHLPPTKFQHTIVLDLDQTLIHCNETLHIPYDVKLNIKFPTGQKIDAGVNIRPHAKQFLQQLSKICEVIIFTASHECYATVVLDNLDPKRQYISHRLFRQHCWQTQQGVYIKDLRVLKNRSLDNIILVDNAAYSYYFQLQNGVPIVPYYDDKQDKQLIMLLTYIKQSIKSSQHNKETIKRLNQKYFKLLEYSKFQDIGPLVQELYTTDSSTHE